MRSSHNNIVLARASNDRAGLESTVHRKARAYSSQQRRTYCTTARHVHDTFPLRATPWVETGSSAAAPHVAVRVAHPSVGVGARSSCTGMLANTLLRKLSMCSCLSGTCHHRMSTAQNRRAHAACPTWTPLRVRSSSPLHRLLCKGCPRGMWATRADVATCCGAWQSDSHAAL